MNRRILISLMIIGLVGAGLGGTTLAMFNDTETSQGNEFTAGELDLRVDWEESYNGDQVETQELTNDPGSIFNLEDLKPGDKGEATVSLHLEDNPGWIWMSLDQTSNWDNACTEPERAAEGQCGSEGELDEELEFVIWADDGDNVLQDDENVIFEGTAQELEEHSTAEGLLLDGDTSTNETEPFAGEETGYIGVKWNLPLETGNHIQGDSVSYDVEFYTEQRRHNDNPDNPWDSENDTEEPEPPVDETPEDDNETEEPGDDDETEEPSGDLTFNDQTVNEDGEVTVNNVSTGQDSTVFVTYESENGTVNAGAHNAPADLENFDPMTIDIEEAGVPGEYAAHVVPKDEVSGYDGSGGLMSQSTLDAVVHTDTAQISAAEEEPVESSGNLTFNDQMVNEDGEVTVNNVSTTEDTSVYVTYEDGGDTILAGVHNANAGLENFDPMNVDIDESAVPGEYTARMIKKPVSYAYSPGDALNEDTLEKEYFSQSAQISAAEEEAEYTAEQDGDTITIEPIEGDETVQELYDFRLPESFNNEADNNATNGATYGGGSTYGSAGTEDLQEGDTSIMFLYEGPEGVSLVVVHEGQGSQDGGSATFEITDLEGGEWKVKDDLYLNADGTKASNNYDIWNTDTNPQTIDWTWGSGGSDGGVYSPLAENFSFTISPAFNEEAGLYDDNFYDGEVDEWQVLSGDRDNPDRTSLNMSQDVTVSAN